MKSDDDDYQAKKLARVRAQGKMKKISKGSLSLHP